MFGRVRLDQYSWQVRCSLYPMGKPISPRGAVYESRRIHKCLILRLGQRGASASHVPLRGVCRDLFSGEETEHSLKGR